MHYRNNHHIERIIRPKQCSLRERVNKAVVLCLHVSKKNYIYIYNSVLHSGCSYNLEMVCSLWKFSICLVCHFPLLCLRGKAIWEAGSHGRGGLGKIVQVSKFNREECRWRWCGLYISTLSRGEGLAMSCELVVNAIQTLFTSINLFMCVCAKQNIKGTCKEVRKLHSLHWASKPFPAYPVGQKHDM